MSYNMVTINTLHGTIEVEEDCESLDEAGFYDYDDTIEGLGKKLHDVIVLDADEVQRSAFLGKKVTKVPKKLFDIFKEAFERVQTSVFSEELKDNGIIDVCAYAEDFVSDYNVGVTVSEDKSDSNYILFNSTVGQMMGIEPKVLKKDFWSSDFGSKYPKMTFLKDFVVAALSEWEKRGIRSDKVDTIDLICDVNMLVDFGKLEEYTMCDGIGRVYDYPWDGDDPSTEGTYNLVYELSSRIDKSRRKLEALRSIMNYKIEQGDWEGEVSDEELLRLEELRVTEGDDTIAMEYDFE